MTTRLSRFALALLFAVVSACGESPQEAPGDDPIRLPAAVAPTMAHTTVVKLRSSENGVQRTYPVILTAGRTQQWDSAFVLRCGDCALALSAFGYSLQSLQFVPSYDSEAALRADNRVADDVRLLALSLDPADAARAVVAAYRVIDAAADAPAAYLVRLRAAPDTLYAATCANFLRVLHGSLDTVPVSSQLLARWGLPALPRIGCSSFDGVALPAPAPAAAVQPGDDVATIVDAWSVDRAVPGVRATPFPYLVTRDARGALRGFAIDCGSEAFGALRALGIGGGDLRAQPPSEAELAGTHLGEQPVLSCGGASILAVTSSNDPARRVHFQTGGQRDLLAFSCLETESFWRARAGSALEAPVQALGHLTLAALEAPAPRIFQVGCRADAARVRAFLGQIRGTRIVTGQHNRNPIDTPARWTAEVRAVTGVSPGMWSSDFQFAAADVQSRATMIAEAQRQWQAGSLVRLAWQACAPTILGSSCTFEPGAGIRSTLSDAQWRELLTEGTRLNASWKARLDEVVPFLRQLAERGVVVIWSPLHFPNDGWAWWQNRAGPAGSSALYRLSHRYLTEDKQLKNLIWEWNVKDVGDPSGLASYYPGADVVDVVSLSPWQSTFPTPAFHDAARAIAGDKPLALGELTRLPTEAELASQPGWSYFSVWAEELAEANTPAQIRAAYRLPRAMNRGHIPFLAARPETVVAEPPEVAAPTPPTSPDGPTAAARLGWGTPLPESDEFDVPGRPDPAKWGVPTGPDDCQLGHKNNGRRCAKNLTIVNGLLRLTGQKNGDTGLIASKLKRQYGRVEVRVRSANTGPSNDREYHPLLLIWPTGSWPDDGEYDFLENSTPAAKCAAAHIHYPHPNPEPIEQESVEDTVCRAPLSEWHNIGFEWTKDHVAGFIDGREWFRFFDGAGPRGRKAIQAMPAGKLHIQLDNFFGDDLTPAVEEIDWVRFYR